ncbi:hypothetical protein V7O66_13760 [Methanolobus sp. ZRKC3]|uniref:hypothetical protein n=1 Tax=Methanolobus sp. ZRKC3 TaxID=3125786 RepID=UPI00324476D8
MSFDLFDYPRTITKVDVTEGYTNQSTGEWVPESTIETSISAHITDISLKERQYLDAAVLEKGARKLSCESSAGVVVGDRIKITEEDSSETEWIVNSKLSESSLMKQYVNVSRSTFLLVRK